MSALVELATFAPPDTALERRGDGTVILTSRHPLAAYERSIPEVLRKRAAAHPDRPLAAQRDERDRWIPLSYAEARGRANALAGSFLELGPTGSAAGRRRVMSHPSTA
jgi:feruloyl-CoA synthase